MSEQNKSNFQALGAGFLGFAAVMVVGGGALMLHNSHQAKLAAHPAAAAAPIDLGIASPRPMSSGLSALKEQRQESPAPLIGDQSSAAPAPGASSVVASEGRTAADSAPKAAAPAAQTAQAARSAEGAAASELETSEHLASTGNGSTAESAVKNTLHSKQARKAKKSETTASAGAAKTDASGDAIASVHYGVTNRNELMGRAAGPVYNFSGGAKGGDTAAKGQLAGGDAKAQIADIRKQLENANLPPEQRASLLKQIDAAGAAAEGK